MPVVVSAETSVPLAQAWAWWTDYGEVGVETLVEHGLGRSLRVVKTRVGRRVVLEERAAAFGGRLLPPVRHSVDVDDAARVLHETSVTFEARWSFEPTPEGGTRVTRAFTPRGLGRISPGGLTRRALDKDLRTHVRQMEKDLLPA